MSNRRMYQFLYSRQPKLTTINGAVTFGATGAVTGTSFGPGVQGVTRMGTGLYKVKLTDNYVAYIGSTLNMAGGPTGSAVTDGSFVTGTMYQITTLGTTNWAAIGYDSDFTPAIGGVFVATGAGGAGGGTATAIGPSGIIGTEAALNPQATIKNNFPSLNRGSMIYISTFGIPPSGQVPLLANPAQGSRLSFRFWFRDSSVSAY